MTKWKHLIGTFLLSQAALMGHGSLAQEHGGDGVWQHEITGGTDSTLSFSSDTTRLGVNVGYKYLILPDIGLQLGYDTSIDFTRQTKVNTISWDNIFGVRYNVQLASESTGSGTDLSNRFFVDFGAGFRFGKVTGTDSQTKFIYDIGLGKRFAFSDRVSYAPRISVRHVADQKMMFNITPISFSFFL